MLEQYASGKRDDLPYRIARRDMHNADAAVTVAVTANDTGNITAIAIAAARSPVQGPPGAQ